MGGEVRSDSVISLCHMESSVWVLPLQVSYLSEILLVFLHISVRERKKEVILDQLFILDHNSLMILGRLSTEIKSLYASGIE